MSLLNPARKIYRRWKKIHLKTSTIGREPWTLKVKSQFYCSSCYLYWSFFRVVIVLCDFYRHNWYKSKRRQRKAHVLILYTLMLENRRAGGVQAGADCKTKILLTWISARIHLSWSNFDRNLISKTLYCNTRQANFSALTRCIKSHVELIRLRRFNLAMITCS